MAGLAKDNVFAPGVSPKVVRCRSVELEEGRGESLKIPNSLGGSQPQWSLLLSV